VLGIAGQKSKEFQKFGQSRVTDDMLEREMTVNVNVGMGATDPTVRMQRLGAALSFMSHLMKMPPSGVNLGEVFRELFALAGYQYGDRFMSQDPKIALMERQVQALGMKLGVQVKNKEGEQKTKLQVSREKNATAVTMKRMEIEGAAQQKQAEMMIQDRAAQLDFASKSDLANQQATQQGAAADKDREFQKGQAEAGFAHEKEMKETAIVEKRVTSLEENQNKLVEGFNKLAQMLDAKFKEKPKPRRRTGKARLPSGKEMSFEVNEE
jgi:hypothetical protein